MQGVDDDGVAGVDQRADAIEDQVDRVAGPDQQHLRRRRRADVVAQSEVARDDRGQHAGRPDASRHVGGGDGVTHRPMRAAHVGATVNGVGRADDPHHRPARHLIEPLVADRFGEIGLAGDHPGRRQVQDGMQALADAHVEAAAVAEQNLGITDVRRRFEEGQHPGRPGDEDRDHQTHQQRPHLPAHGVVNHPRVGPDQRVLEPADQEPIAVDLRARRDLRGHMCTPINVGPAPSLGSV